MGRHEPHEIVLLQEVIFFHIPSNIILAFLKASPILTVCGMTSEKGSPPIGGQFRGACRPIAAL